jgi:hypothetical protein
MDDKMVTRDGQLPLAARVRPVHSYTGREMLLWCQPPMEVLLAHCIVWLPLGWT